MKATLARRSDLFLLYNALLLAGGTLLPWIDPSLFSLSLRGYELSDGKLLLAVAAAAAIVSLINLAARERKVGNGVHLLAGAIGLFVTLFEIVDFSRRRYIIGPGVYVSLIASVQMLAGVAVQALRAVFPHFFVDEKIGRLL